MLRELRSSLERHSHETELRERGVQHLRRENPPVLSLRFKTPPSVQSGLSPPLYSAQHGGDSGATQPLAEGAPGVWDVFTSDRRVRSSVPKGAKDAWSRCLIAALADVVAHRDVKSWTDLLTLPALVLPAPSRGGWRHVLRQEGEPAAVVWTGSVASGLIFGTLLRFVRLRAATRLPRMMMEASFPLRSLPG